jgi:HD-GYP domain-containing protein (c-di-GMP phosphodiesterase class II)
MAALLLDDRNAGLSGVARRKAAATPDGKRTLDAAAQIRRLEQRIHDTVAQTVRALANTLEARDRYTSGHSQRVARLARLTGAALGLDAGRLRTLEWAGMLHDVGKLGVPEAILNKPGRLNPGEWELVRRHPALSYDVVRPVRSLAPILDGVLHHHENYDGSGYPAGLAGDAIPLAARIIHVVDIFDALTSPRAYRDALPFDAALRELRAGAGWITDPYVTHIFLDALARCRDGQQDADDSRGPAVYATVGG